MLSSMQQKLDSLCEQLNNVKDCSGAENVSLSSVKGLNLHDHEVFGSERAKFVDWGCWLCDQHHDQFNRVVPVRSRSISSFVLIDHCILSLFKALDFLVNLVAGKLCDESDR